MQHTLLLIFNCECITGAASEECGDTEDIAAGFMDLCIDSDDDSVITRWLLLLGFFKSPLPVYEVGV